ncbi:hypothetical protein RYX36_001730 [Vicia faba]
MMILLVVSTGAVAKHLRKDEGAALVTQLLDQIVKSEEYGERRGDAFGLAGLLKGNFAKSREEALLEFECLCETLGKQFEPYMIQNATLLLVSFSDQVAAVQEAAECAARAMMSQLSAQGVKLVLPSFLKQYLSKCTKFHPLQASLRSYQNLLRQSMPHHLHCWYQYSTEV